MTSPFRTFLPLAILIAVGALAFSAYVVLDGDLRTLVWDKWTGEIAYNFPGDQSDVSIEVAAEGRERRVEIPYAVMGAIGLTVAVLFLAGLSAWRRRRSHAPHAPIREEARMSHSPGPQGEHRSSRPYQPY